MRNSVQARRVRRSRRPKRIHANGKAKTRNWVVTIERFQQTILACGLFSPNRPGSDRLAVRWLISHGRMVLNMNLKQRKARMNAEPPVRQPKDTRVRR